MEGHNLGRGGGVNDLEGFTKEVTFKLSPKG